MVKTRETEPYEVNIYKAVHKNRLIVIGSLVCLMLAFIACLVFMFKVYTHKIDSILVVNQQGEIIPVEWQQKKEVLTNQMKFHVLMWFENYYNLDRGSVDENRQKALWLINGEDFAQLERYYNQKGWFEDIKRFGIVQKIEVAEIRLSGNAEPFSFLADCQITTRQNGIEKRYQLQAGGDLIFVESDYPRNPNGMLIINYKEKPWEEIIEN